MSQPVRDMLTARAGVPGHIPSAREDLAAFTQFGWWAWWSLLALHAVAICAGLFDDNTLVCAVGCSSLVLLLSCWYVFTKGPLYPLMLALVHMAGTTMQYGYMNFAYLKFTTLRTGDYHDVSAWLGALSVLCTAVGAGLTHILLGRGHPQSHPSSTVMRWQTVFVFASIFVVMAAGHVSTGYLDARWDTSSAGSGAKYLVDGIGGIWLTFFFVLGTRLRGRLSTPTNLWILSILVFFAVLQSLSGGRGMSFFMVLLALGGAAWGYLERRSLMILIAGFVLLGVVFATAVNEARGTRGFAFGTAQDRVDILGQTTQNAAQGLSSSSSAQGALEPLIARMFEFSGQDMIDYTVHTQRFAGFENFGRLRYLFVPKALAPDKEPIADGVETLVRELGYNLEFVSVPITLVADSYRRGGELWVAAVALLVGCVLRLITWFVVLVVGSDFAMLFVAPYAMAIVGLHGESVMGAISVLLYQMSKLLLIFLFATFAVRFGIWILEPRDIGGRVPHA